MRSIVDFYKNRVWKTRPATDDEIASQGPIKSPKRWVLFCEVDGESSKYKVLTLFDEVPLWARENKPPSTREFPKVLYPNGPHIINDNGFVYGVKPGKDHGQESQNTTHAGRSDMPPLTMETIREAMRDCIHPMERLAREKGFCLDGGDICITPIGFHKATGLTQHINVKESPYAKDIYLVKNPWPGGARWIDERQTTGER